MEKSSSHSTATRDHESPSATNHSGGDPAPRSSSLHSEQLTSHQKDQQQLTRASSAFLSADDRLHDKQPRRTSTPQGPSSQRNDGGELRTENGGATQQQQQQQQQHVRNERQQTGSSSSSVRPASQLVTCPTHRFVRQGRIGRGAYKEVFRAMDEEEGIEVAWSEIDFSQCISKWKVRQEVDLLKRLDHQNIIGCFASWEDAERRCIVFVSELMTSGTLAEFIGQQSLKRLKRHAIERYGAQILQGLSYLHHNDVIHRDLKCHNVFINGSKGEVKIGDLGVSIASRHATSVIGTPEYMAPEMFSEHYTNAVDIWSFGLCLLEMATGSRPYAECSNIGQIYLKVSTGVLPSLDEVDDEEVRDLIRTCLAFQPGDRPTAHQLLEHPLFASSQSNQQQQQQQQQNRRCHQGSNADDDAAEAAALGATTTTTTSDGCNEGSFESKDDENDVKRRNHHPANGSEAKSPSSGLGIENDSMVCASSAALGLPLELPPPATRPPEFSILERLQLVEWLRNSPPPVASEILQFALRRLWIDAADADSISHTYNNSISRAGSVGGTGWGFYQQFSRAPSLNTGGDGEDGGDSGARITSPAVTAPQPVNVEAKVSGAMPSHHHNITIPIPSQSLVDLHVLTTPPPQQPLPSAAPNEHDDPFSNEFRNGPQQSSSLWGGDRASTAYSLPQVSPSSSHQPQASGSTSSANLVQPSPSPPPQPGDGYAKNVASLVTSPRPMHQSPGMFSSQPSPNSFVVEHEAALGPEGTRKPPKPAASSSVLPQEHYPGRPPLPPVVASPSPAFSASASHDSVTPTASSLNHPSMLRPLSTNSLRIDVSRSTPTDLAAFGAGASGFPQIPPSPSSACATSTTTSNGVAAAAADDHNERRRKAAAESEQKLLAQFQMFLPTGAAAAAGGGGFLEKAGGNNVSNPSIHGLDSPPVPAEVITSSSVVPSAVDVSPCYALKGSVVGGAGGQALVNGSATHVDEAVGGLSSVASGGVGSLFGSPSREDSIGGEEKQSGRPSFDDITTAMLHHPSTS